MSEQALVGFFRRFGRVKAAFCNMHLGYNLVRIFNVLESIEGRDGIYIYKNKGAEGYGWTIGIDKTGGLYGDADAVDSFEDGAKRRSIETKSFTLGPVTLQVKQLYKFDNPDTNAVLTGNSANWSTEKTWQKVCIRRMDVDDNAEIQFCTFYPVPAGDATNTALTWDDSKGAWVKGLPATGGLTASDFESIDVLVPGTTWDATNHRFQMVKKSVKVLKTTAAARNSDTLTFAAFSD